MGPVLLAFAICLGPACAFAQQPVLASRPVSQDVYIPIDSWVYGALDRLHGLGYLDTAFLGIRPWTRRSIGKMLIEADLEDDIHEDPQAEEIFQALRREFPEAGASESIAWSSPTRAYESVYTRLQGIAEASAKEASSWEERQRYKGQRKRSGRLCWKG